MQGAPHPFTTRPHRTLLRLSTGVLFSLIAEPVTGVVDTHFISRLGSTPLAALGVATTVLSSAFWMFAFLNAGTQTETARAHGAGSTRKMQESATGAIVLSVVLGVVVALAVLPFLASFVRWMGATGEVATIAREYMAIRLLSAPAVLLTFATFGVLRGIQDMRTPLWIALVLNACNIALDRVLIFGLGPVPALGVNGAAWASVASHWIGAVWGVIAVVRCVGFRREVTWTSSRRLLIIGRDLILRVGCLNLFLVLTTRAATLVGVEAGAAHQAVRQAWFFSALFLDSFAMTAQSLVAFFLGAEREADAHRVASVAVLWGGVSGLLIGLAMVAAHDPTARWLVPADARVWFTSCWFLCALYQPLGGISFATDGVHWGASDFAYLRNVVILATSVAVIALLLVDLDSPNALTLIWATNGLWILVRTVLGVLRIWPGIGDAPLGRRPKA